MFAAYAVLDRDYVTRPEIVRVTAAEVGWLADIWARQWRRPPDETELRGIVLDYLRETLLAREARALKLDVDDSVVRRRLAQKMEFLAQDAAELSEPSDEDLRAYYDRAQSRYRTPLRISFTQVFFKSDAAARRGLVELAARQPDQLGDPSLLARRYFQSDAQTVSDIFGRAFAELAFARPVGEWYGPVKSPYGTHLVRIDQRQPERMRSFDDARAQVLEDWRRDQEAKATARLFVSLLKKYDIVVDAAVKPLVASAIETAR